MSDPGASSPSIARSLLVVALILAPGIVAAGLELRHSLPDASLATRLDEARAATQELAPFEERLDALAAAEARLKERIRLIDRLKDEQACPAGALAETGRRVPKGFAVSELSCTRDAGAAGSEWLIVIEGDPTDAEAADWAGLHGTPMDAGHRVEMRLPIDSEIARERKVGESPWW